MEIAAVTIGISAVRKAARAPIGHRTAHTAAPAETASACAERRHAAAIPRVALITLGCPRVNDATVVEAVNDEAGGVTQHHVAIVADRGTPEPLVGRWRSLVACGCNLLVTHNHIDRVVFGEGLVERDAGAERQEGFVARVWVFRRRLEADSGSSVG